MPVGTEEELQRAIAQMLKGEFPVEEQTQNTYAKVIGFWNGKSGRRKSSG